MPLGSTSGSSSGQPLFSCWGRSPGGCSSPWNQPFPDWTAPLCAWIMFLECLSERFGQSWSLARDNEGLPTECEWAARHLEKPWGYSLGMEVIHEAWEILSRNKMNFSIVFPTSVPSLLEERRQQASDHAAAAKAVQEPNHFRLQDPGCRVHQHGWGELLFTWSVYTRGHSPFSSNPLLSLSSLRSTWQNFK